MDDDKHRPMTSPESKPEGARKGFRPRRRWLLAGGAALIIFLSGFVAGSGLTAKFLWGRLMTAVRDPAGFADRITDRLDRRLDLRPEQEEKIRRVVLTRQKKILALGAEVRPRIVAELEAMRREVETELLPEQREKWNRHFKIMRRFWLKPLPEAAGPDR